MSNGSRLRAMRAIGCPPCFARSLRSSRPWPCRRLWQPPEGPGAVGRRTCRPGPDLRRGDRQRPRGGRHRRAMVPGRRRHHRRPHHRDRQPVVRPCGHAHRRRGAGGGAGLHRPARPVRVQRARRLARRQQDHAGRHHRDHGRGRLDRPGHRRDEGRPQGQLRVLQDRAGLGDRSTSTSPGWRGRRPRSTSARSWARAGSATT